MNRSIHEIIGNLLYDGHFYTDASGRRVAWFQDRDGRRVDRNDPRARYLVGPSTA